MRVTPIFTDSELGGDGTPLITSFRTMDMHGPGRTRHMFSGRNSRYRGFNEAGVDIISSSVAKWASKGAYPQNLIAVLTDQELSLAYPVSEPGQLTLWIRYPRDIPPSAILDDVVDGVSIEWVTKDNPTTGLFGGPSAGRDKVRVGSGGVWVLTEEAVTLLDFTQDRAALYLQVGGILQVVGGGLDPDAFPGGPDLVFAGAPDAFYAVPCAPYRFVYPFHRKTHAFTAIGGGTSVCTLFRNFVEAGGTYVPVEHVDFEAEYGDEYRVSDGVFLSDGRVLVVGFVGKESGPLWWSVRSAVASGMSGGAANWSTPSIPSTGYVATSPKVRVNDAGEAWACFDKGILKWRDSSLDITEASKLSFWTGVRGEDIGVDPRQKALHPSERVVDFAFTRDIPGVLLDPGESRGGNSLLEVLDPAFRQVLYRRRYQSVAYSVNASPLNRPQSPIVVPGHTNSPPPGFGPD